MIWLPSFCKDEEGREWGIEGRGEKRRGEGKRVIGLYGMELNGIERKGKGRD